jgi:hypothetical protein
MEKIEARRQGVKELDGWREKDNWGEGKKKGKKQKTTEHRQGWCLTLS